MHLPERTRVLIIGGGPAGSTAGQSERSASRGRRSRARWCRARGGTRRSARRWPSLHRRARVFPWRSQWRAGLGCRAHRLAARPAAQAAIRTTGAGAMMARSPQDDSGPELAFHAVADSEGRSALSGRAIAAAPVRRPEDATTARTRGAARTRGSSAGRDLGPLCRVPAAAKSAFWFFCVRPPQARFLPGADQPSATERNPSHEGTVPPPLFIVLLTSGVARADSIGRRRAVHPRRRVKRADGSSPGARCWCSTTAGAHRAPQLSKSATADRGRATDAGR